MPAVFIHRPTAESLDRLGPVRRFVRVWAPALIGVAVIAIESQPTFSAANTSHWLRPVWERLFGPISAQSWEELHHYLRKTGHFFYYGFLCVLFLRAWLLTLARNSKLSTAVWRWRSWLLGVASTFLVASADEFHQSFLPSRTGTFSDVILDTCGGIVISGLVIFIAWCLRRAVIRTRPR